MIQLYIQDASGIVYDNDQLGFVINEKTVPDMPELTVIKDEVPYGYRDYVYRRKYENREISIGITMIATNFSTLATAIHKLNGVLAGELSLMFAESGYVYNCNLDGGIGQETMVDHTKQYNLTFITTSPYKFGPQNTLAQLKAANGVYTGKSLRVTTPQNFTVTGSTTITVTNNGNTKAYPIYKIVGSASSVTIGTMSYLTVSGNLTIDTQKMLCYQDNSGTLVNKLAGLSGTFQLLNPGSNSISVTGTSMNFTLQVTYADTYL